MQKIIVNGGRALEGEIRVSGSKNAALPLIFAALLIDGETTLRNVPDIGDVRVALENRDYTKEILIAGCGEYKRAWGTTFEANAPLVIPDHPTKGPAA